MAGQGVQAFFTAMWMTVLIRGLASVVFGVLAFIYPGITLGVLVTVFGIFAIIDGAAALWSAFRGNGGGVTAALQGIAGLVAGVFCLVFPALAAIYVVLLIGVWNIAVGLLQMTGAVVLRKRISNAALFGLGGLLSVVLGILIVLYPANGALSIIWIIAGTAILVGLVLTAFAFTLRRAGLDLVG